MLKHVAIAVALLAGCPSSSTHRSGPTTTTVIGPGQEQTSEEPPVAVAVVEDPGIDPTSAGLLAAHNQVRKAHCAPPLAWSTALADEATAWANSLAANNCAFEHSRSDHGENLAAGTASAMTPDAVVAMWAEEESAYDYKHPGFGMNTGHFTQVAWKSTTAVGCGTATCNGMSLWVCNYDPAGNVEGDFPANLSPPVCQ